MSVSVSTQLIDDEELSMAILKFLWESSDTDVPTQPKDLYKSLNTIKCNFKKRHKKILKLQRGSRDPLQPGLVVSYLPPLLLRQ